MRYFPEFLGSVVFGSASANRTVFKVGDKKDSRTISVNVNWVPLFLKSVTELAFSKVPGLFCKYHREQVSTGSLQGSEHNFLIRIQFKN